MLSILSPETFKTIPWKNGLGHTTELAISDGGTLDNFDWRLSIASVVNDGDFSNFAGYQRNLVLIEGEGLILDHRNGDVDNLTKLLDIAHFDGGCKTNGKLVNGGIKDFNIMTNQQSFTAQVDTYTNSTNVALTANNNVLIFAYSLSGDLTLEQDKKITQVAKGALAKYEQQAVNNESNISISGENMILIQLSKSQ